MRTNTTIRLQNVSARRGLNRQVFSSVSSELSEFPLVILGPNGAGKSTLFGLLSGARRPTRGRAIVSGASGSWSKTTALRRHVGLVPQQTLGLRGLTVRELVAYAGWLKGMARAQAWASSERVLAQLNLARLASTSSVAISGGEGRRMMIAMALVSDPEVILFDEPTTGLDPTERSNVLGLVATIAQERPIIVATHEIDDIEERFPHLAVLDRGEFAFRGTAGEFLSLGSGSSPRARAEEAYRNILTEHRSSPHA